MRPIRWTPRRVAALALAWCMSAVVCVTVAIPTVCGQINPPRPSGGVSGTGAGVTDAAAFRTALALGTAAVVNTGVISGAVPVLGAAGLPAIGASLLTGITASQVGAQASDATLTAVAAWAWTSGTEVKTLTAADTFGTINVGTGNNNLVQLNGSGQLPAVSGALLTGVPGVTQKTVTVNTGALTVAQTANVLITGAYTQGTIDLIRFTPNVNSTASMRLQLFDGDPAAGGVKIADIFGSDVSGLLIAFADDVAVAGPTWTIPAAITFGSAIPYVRTNNLYIQVYMGGGGGIFDSVIDVYMRERI